MLCGTHGLRHTYGVAGQEAQAAARSWCLWRLRSTSRGWESKDEWLINKRQRFRYRSLLGSFSLNSPSTGKSSNSSSSSSAAAGFCWSLLSAPLSVSLTTAFLVFMSPCAAADMLGGCGMRWFRWGCGWRIARTGRGEWLSWCRGG